MYDISPLRAEPQPQKPEMVDVLLINGTLNNGRDFDFALRIDKGDELLEDATYLTVVNGTNGQRITIRQDQIAVLSRVTRQMPKELPKTTESKEKQRLFE